jgi:hypothetical protein
MMRIRTSGSSIKEGIKDGEDSSRHATPRRCCATNSTLSDWRKLARNCYPAGHAALHCLLRGFGWPEAFGRSTAVGLYEAAVLRLTAFKKHDYRPGATTQPDVEVRSSIVHSVPVHKVSRWLARGVNSPKEAILKERLRSLL